MPGHIFDANTIRSLALADALWIVPTVCPVPLVLAQTVRDELRDGAIRFPKRNAHRALEPQWAAFISRFQGLEASLGRLGFGVRAVTDNPAHEDMYAFLACLMDEDLVEAGEAESLALAAYRGFTLYSDERKVLETVQAFNEDRFPCPYLDRAEPPHRTLEVHSTAWVLLEARSRNAITMVQAEAYWLEMKDVARLPKQTLAELEAGNGQYW